jgi:hypothetical protein
MANPKHLSKLKEGAGTLVRALGQLLQNLRSVSTSAPAGNIRVKPNMVSRGIWHDFKLRCGFGIGSVD